LTVATLVDPGFKKAFSGPAVVVKVVRELIESVEENDHQSEEPPTEK